MDNIPWSIIVVGTAAFLLGFFLFFFMDFFLNKKEKKEKVIIVVEADSMKKILDSQQKYPSDNVEIMVVDKHTDMVG